MKDLKIKNPEKIAIFSGNANRPLAEAICANLAIPLGKAKVTRFADGEVKVNLEENVRKKEVFIIQSTNPPAENWDELCFLIDAARRASASQITTVVPYCGYSRQERKDEPHVSISLKVKLDQVVAAGANRIVTCDLHSGASQGFINIPFDNLFATPLLLEKSTDLLKDFENACLITDLGYGKIAGVYAKKLGLELVIARKVRPVNAENELEDKIELVGNIKKKALFIDDIGDTFKTAKKIGNEAKKAGAEFLAAALIHGVFSRNKNPENDAVSNITTSPFEKIVITDSINVPNETKSQINDILHEIKVVSLDRLLASAIKEIYEGGSVSRIFERDLNNLKGLIKKS